MPDEPDFTILLHLIIDLSTRHAMLTRSQGTAFSTHHADVEHQLRMRYLDFVGECGVD